MSIDNLQTVNLPTDDEQTGIQKLNSNVPLVQDHDHTPGKGTPITPAAMSINEDLTINAQKLIDIGGAVLTNTANTKINLEAYTDGTDLFFQDGNGNTVKMTTGGLVNVSGSGNISGLSGQAGLAFSGSTFQFTDSIGGRANVLIKNAQLVNNGNTVTITHNATGTRTITLPDETTTLVGIDSNQTLTNKTLSNPVVNGPTISGGTQSTTALTGVTVASSTVSNSTVSVGNLNACFFKNSAKISTTTNNETITLSADQNTTTEITASHNFTLSLGTISDGAKLDIILIADPNLIEGVTVTFSGFNVSGATSLPLSIFGGPRVIEVINTTNGGIIATHVRETSRQVRTEAPSTQLGIAVVSSRVNFTWQCPLNVTFIEILMAGAGATGQQQSSSSSRGAGGGAGGVLQQTIAVRGGRTYNIAVALGSGGSNTTNAHLDGLSTTFQGSTTTARINNLSAVVLEATGGSGTTSGAGTIVRNDITGTFETLVGDVVTTGVGAKNFLENGGPVQQNGNGGGGGGGAGFESGFNFVGPTGTGGAGGNGGIVIIFDGFDDEGNIVSV